MQYLVGSNVPYLLYKLTKENKSMACPSSITSFKFALSTCLTLLLISYSLKSGHASKENPTAEGNFHSVEISSILPSLTCKPSSFKGHPIMLYVSLFHFQILRDSSCRKQLPFSSHFSPFIHNLQTILFHGSFQLFFFFCYSIDRYIFSSSFVFLFHFHT